MIIHYLGDGTFLIKTKTTEIVTGKEVRVGELTLSGPGEYEVGDAQIRGYKDAYFCTAEDVNLLYVHNPSGVPDELIKEIEEDIDVLLLSVDHDSSHIRGAIKTMNDLDPKVTFPTVEGAVHPFCKEIGGCPEGVGEFKINSKELVEGERKVVVLHARSRARH